MRTATDEMHMKLLVLRADTMSNVMTLQGELANSQYDEIETQLNAVLALSQEHEEYEFVEYDAASFGDGSLHSPKVGKFLIDAWVKERPRSAWAHYAQALRWYDDTEALAGTWEGDVPPEMLRKMRQGYENARFELQKAITLNPGIATAWASLLDIDRGLHDLPAAKQDYRNAIAHRPISYLIAGAMANDLGRRGMGDTEMEDDFAGRLAPSFTANPYLRTVLGYATADRACVHCEHLDWQTGLKLFNRALAYSDDIEWLENAADAAVHLGRYALAYRYFERASKYDRDNFKNVMEMSLMYGICNPKETKLQLLESIDQAQTYAGIDKMEYPRGPDDCTYYKAELPWGDEPAPETGDLLAYSIQTETYRAPEKQKP